MNIQKIVNKTIASIQGKLGAEKITVGGQVVDAIPAEAQHDRNLMGGSREEREIDYQFPTVKNLKLRKGMAVSAQDKKWKIESFQRGRAMTTITVIEPNRVEE